MTHLPKTPVSLNNTAVVFLIHGTRNPEAVAFIHDAMKRLCPHFATTLGLPEASVNYSFLEFLDPSLTEALTQFCQAGKTDIRIVPLLLFPGTHLNKDIPAIAETLMQTFPNVTIQTGDCIGVEDPEFTDILLKRLAQLPTPTAAT